MTTKNRVGKRIRERRLAFGLTQAQLSELSGITQGHISQLEKGERVPTVATLRKLRDALVVDDAEFMLWVDAA